MDSLAAVCEQIASWNSRNKKIALLADYLRTLNDQDMSRAVRFLAQGPIAIEGGRKFSIGGTVLREALLQVVPWDATTVAHCHQATGDSGETVALLLQGRNEGRPMSLLEAEHFYARLYKCRKTIDRVALLAQVYRGHRPETLKYFIKVITGNLRIGLHSRTVEEAVAVSVGIAPAEIRHANNRMGDLASVALAARRGALHEIEARLFHPMDFMLAKPLELLESLPDAENWWVEEKYDGIRSQIHTNGKRTVIFTRGLEDTTSAFPEVADKFTGFRERLVLDGEILAWRDGKPLPFNVLQQRLARKKVAAKHLTGIPVVFIAYDILYRGDRMLLDLTIEERRTQLEEALCETRDGILISPITRSQGIDAIEQAFHDARDHGNEGLVLKQYGSPYEPGKRSGAWLKVKRPYATLDVVVTAAETGTGRRAVFLSDYTFGVRSGDEFVNVGKAYSGLTDAEIRELTRILRAAALNRFGRVTLVRPEIVLEVAFDGVQKSPRHKGGYALRFPRIVRWRRDKKPEEADTLDRVRALYEASLVSGAIHAKDPA